MQIGNFNLWIRLLSLHVVLIDYVIPIDNTVNEKS